MIPGRLLFRKTENDLDDFIRLFLLYQADLAVPLAYRNREYILQNYWLEDSLLTRMMKGGRSFWRRMTEEAEGALVPHRFPARQHKSVEAFGGSDAELFVFRKRTL